MNRPSSDRYRPQDTDWIARFRREVEPRLTFDSVFGDLPGARKSGDKVRAPCPLHGGRHLNLVIDPNTLRWFCHSKCNSGGGPLEYVHRRSGASGALQGRALVELMRELCESFGAPLTEVPIRDRPGSPDAQAVWNAAGAVTDDREVVEWLARHRKLEPDLIARLDLARVVCARQDVPAWAGFERAGRWKSWPSAGYRVVVPLVDWSGNVRSLRFRKPRPGAQGRSASGLSGVGLVMADAIACSVLASGRVPDFWTGTPFSIVIAEGEPDFWSWATEPARSGVGHSATSFPPAIGVVSGSFDASIAQRLPHGTDVLSALDRDEAGDRMHERLVRVLREAGRDLSVSRWRPHE